MKNDQQALNTANANLSSARSTVRPTAASRATGLQASAVQQSQAQEQVAMAQAQQVRVQIGKGGDRFADRRRRREPQHQPRRVPGQPPDLHAAAGQPDLRGAARFERSKSRRIAKRRAGDRHRARPQRHAAFRGPRHRRAQPDQSRVDRFPGQGAARRIRGRSCAPGWSCKGRSRRCRCAACAFRSPPLPTTITTRVMTVQQDGSVKTVKVAESGSDGTTSVVSGAIRRNAHRQQRPDQRRRRREGLLPAVKFSLTRLFIKRPTLVFVIIALMVFARHPLDGDDRQGALSRRQPADRDDLGRL